MRINGRILRPATLAERRLLLSLGSPFLKVPRHLNPFILARRLRRAAREGTSVLALLDAKRDPAASRAA